MKPLDIREFQRNSPPLAKHRRPGTISTCETSYRDLLGREAFARLKPEVRQRFSVRPGRHEHIRYTGIMHSVELSFAGWLFAQFCRLFGTPLAPYRGKNVRMDIDLAWDETLHGVVWNRAYYFVPDKKYTVRSTKSRGANGRLIEHIGRGLSMRLKLSERAGMLVFTSTRYQFDIAGFRIGIPALLTPGVTTVVHEQIEGDRFRFILSVDHPILGNTIYQDGEFYSSVSER
jgi:hypothetical protein